MTIVARLCLVAAFIAGVTLGAPGAVRVALSGEAITINDASALPQHLRDTGLFIADSVSQVRPENLSFSPQYPLWSDGAIKRRWLYLPPGKTIDASDPDAWEFPLGTRLWKEFGYAGRAIETRFIERRADGSWRYASYIWNADGSDAVLAPVDGIAALPAPNAPGGRYAIPAEMDCRACHEAAAVPVLGVSALQLSPDRDSLAPHAEPARAEHLNLPGIVARGLIRNLPTAFLANPPRVAAATPTARAALGYLHGNCGHCHNDAGPLAALDLVLAQQTAISAKASTESLDSLIGEASRFRQHGAVQRIVPGSSDASVLTRRMQSRDSLTQMPPLGTQIIDAEGMALVTRWINHDLQPPKESTLKELTP